ncbi:MAG: mechanosensitive ion channel family protein [Marinilabiliaceae bacterium]|nr:mechanosensitive ion channel family protein [Marinilabiliaceae bacterium]
MKKILLLFYSIIISLNAIPQSDSTKINTDSVQQNIMNQTVSLMKQNDSISFADSISKEVLRKQMDELRSYETNKRIKLQAELDAIVNKENKQKNKLKREVDSLKRITSGFPIIVHKDTIFKIFTNIGTVSAQERSHIITRRLLEIYPNFSTKKDSIHISDNGQYTEIGYNDRIIVSITDLDEMWLEKPKKVIAKEIQTAILSDIKTYKKNRSIIKYIKEIGLSILVIGILWILIKLINHLFRAKVNTFIRSKRDEWFNGIKIRNYEILDSSRQTTGLMFIAKIIKYALILLLLYISIPVLFSIFPPTKQIAETLFGYILSPLSNIFMGIVSYIPELITIIIIVSITRYFLRFLKFLSNEVALEKLTIPGFFPDWSKPTYNIIKVFVLAFMFVAIFPYLPGSDSNVFKGVSVFLGIVFSLGSSSIIGNMVAGIVITYMRPFKLGDRIKIDEIVGDVVEKTPFVTRIKTPKKEFITIPNSNILSSNIINYSTSKQQDGIILHTTVTIGYDVPWRKVHEMLINAAKKTSHIKTDIEPFVLQTSLDDFFVSYQLNVHTNEPNMQPAIYSVLHQNIQDAFNEAGVEILSPHYRAERDGNPTTIPNI